MAEHKPQTPVMVSLRLLSANSLPIESLTAAFGPSSLGIILVKDLPPQFVELRLRLLQYASYLAHLPPSELERLTVAEAKYLTGWSHGVETLASGKKDSLKGSWYTNCTFYKEHHSAISEGGPGQGREAAVADLACDEEALHPGSCNRDSGVEHDDFPEYTSPNVWPAEELLPGFRATLERLCCLIIDVAVLVARQCDRFAMETKIKGYEVGYLERIVRTSKTTKARLLHYFPPNKPVQRDEKETANLVSDDWCTTHKDHGCLTGLTSALFVDESDPVPVLKQQSKSDIFELPSLHVLNGSPDPSAGLYIRSRTGELAKVVIPPDCLAFQTGECLERITKGRFAAVPHLVRGPSLKQATDPWKVARNTLAVFTQPNLSEHVDEKGTTFADFAREIIGKNTAG